MSKDAFIMAVKGKLVIPEKWTGREFRRNGVQLIRAIDRAGKIVQRKAIPELVRRTKSIITGQVNQIVSIATARTRAFKFTALINAGAHENLWAMAIQEVLGKEATVEVITELVPPIRSVMDQGHSKTGALLNVQSGREEKLKQQSWEIAKKITKINDTTRKTIERIVLDGVENGLGPAEVADQIQSRVPDIIESRSMCIARTELNNAWTKGSIVAYQQVPTLTHVSVVGCEAREANSPQYRGESTCNIQDVPVADSWKLEFHPNHTGTLIPSRFRDE